MAMRFRMLGPLRVRTGDGWAPVAAEQQRVVLAVLLVDAGRAVSTDKLVDAVWGERPPRTATNTVQAYVSRLRRLIGHDMLASCGGGYVLLAEDGEVDAVVFERVRASGRRELEAGRLESAETRLAQALALWPGPEPVFADVPANLWTQPRVTHLERLRLGAAEDYADARLRLGQHASIVEELERLVAEQPLREQRWLLLMTALQRGGRRAEALEAYQRARRILHTELGLEPNESLRQLQQEILEAARFH
jgi:DNA-binding SARP family transcriptional activator